ncbi:MAG: MarR family transcriptional regulator [Mesorhizobium sp.]
MTQMDDDQESKDRLRLWIRILRVSRLIEAELRELLKSEFDTTLPRFDVMSALSRVSEGMLMSDLSRFLLVSNGNVTGIVDRLVQDGLVIRSQREGDRRTSIVSLTPQGRDLFARMAEIHEGWINKAMAGVPSHEAKHLADTLKAFRSNWEVDK